MTTKNKADVIVATEKLRLIESEIFSLSSRYGIETIDDLENLISSGKINENDLGDDFFRLDYLIAQKNELEKTFKSLSINKLAIWKNFQDLLELPRQSFLTS